MLRTFGVLVAGAVLMTVALADEVTSGLAVGQGPKAFHPLNVTGEYAGQDTCLV